MAAQQQRSFNKPIPVTALKEKKLAINSFDKENGVLWSLKFDYIFGGVHLIAEGFPVTKDSGKKPTSIRARFNLIGAQTLLGIVNEIIEKASKKEAVEPYIIQTFKDNPNNKREKLLDGVVVIGYDAGGIYIGLTDGNDAEKKRRFHINPGQYNILLQGNSPLTNFESSLRAAQGWVKTFEHLLTVVAGAVYDTPPHEEERNASRNSNYQQPSSSPAQQPSSFPNFDDDISY